MNKHTVQDKPDLDNLPPIRSRLLQMNKHTAQDKPDLDNLAPIRSRLLQMNKQFKINQT